MKNLIQLIFISAQITLTPFFSFGQITLNLSIESNRVLPMDGIDIIFKIKNQDADTVNINYPSIYQETIEIILMSNNKKIYRNVVWDGSVGVSKTLLAPKAEIEYEFDLTAIYPYLYESGEYIISAKYFIDERDSFIESENSVSFFMEPLSKKEEMARQAFMKLLFTGTKEADVKYGFQFLEKYPNSIYSIAAKKRTALSLSRLDKYDEAILLFKSALETDGLSKRMQGELISDLSWTYYRKGELQNAIAVLKTLVDTPTKSMLLRKLNREIEERKK